MGQGGVYRNKNQRSPQVSEAVYCYSVQLAATVGKLLSFLLISPSVSLRMLLIYMFRSVSLAGLFVLKLLILSLYF